MISLPFYMRIVRASAWYDLIVTVGFATPWTFMAIHQSLLALSQSMAIPGALPPFEPAHMLMANLLGTVVTLWAVLRLRHTQRVHGQYDAAARFAFAALQLYAVAHGASLLVMGFTVFELLFGVAQLLPIRQSEGY